MRNASSGAVFCSANDNNIFPPVLRILLNSHSPKTIKKIEHDYDTLSCERFAVSMINDEEAGVKIKLEHKSPVTKPARCFELYSDKKGGGLLAKGINLYANTLQVTGPNVDITIRQAPNEGVKHQGVHTVHRLYMAAAFRLLLGADNVGSNTGVAALVVSPSGQILCCGKKNVFHPVLHAEASALIAYGEKLPKGVRLYSTLKPCKMCRAFIQHFASGDDFVVYFGQNDPTLAAMGPMDANKYVLLSNSSTEKPIWADSDKSRPSLLRQTVASKLSEQYSGLHDKEKSLGIINFIKGGKANVQLSNAANYLQVKQLKYANDALEATYNQNVKKCLEHITDVLRELNLPVPVKL